MKKDDVRQLARLGSAQQNKDSLKGMSEMNPNYFTIKFAAMCCGNAYYEGFMNSYEKTQGQILTKDWEVLKALDEGKKLEVWIADDANEWITPDKQSRVEYVEEINSGAIYRIK